MDILKTILKENDLVFDVGCNIGVKTKEYLNEKTKVVCFEPQPSCVDYLYGYFKNNENVFIEPIGLDNKIGESVIYEASHNTISSMSEEFIETVKKERFKGYQWGKKINIKTDTLDNMVTKHGTPTYIKIDVEGYELNVLQGLTNPVDIISIEYTPELKKSTLNCIEYVDKLNNGKSLFNYGYREDKEFKFNEWISKDEITEYITSITDYVFEFGDVYIKLVK
jgi:FkbM family methyltransferase